MANLGNLLHADGVGAVAPTVAHGTNGPAVFEQSGCVLFSPDNYCV